MNSNETIESATMTHEFEVFDGRFGPSDPDCAHDEESKVGEQHDYDEAISAYRVTHVLRCDACGSERCLQTDEEVPA